MQRPVLPLVLAAFLTNLPVGQAQVTIYTDESSFLAAIGSPAQTLTFDANPIANINGTEYPGFTFTALSTSGGTQLSIAPADFFASSPYLNIGERPFQSGDGNEDSLRVDLAGNYRAVGFRVIDAVIPQGAEQIIVYGNSSTALFTWTPANGACAFIGLVATVPIRRLEIFEAVNDSDDVGYDNFMVGLPVAVPEPSSWSLLAAGLSALAWVAKKRDSIRHTECRLD